MKKLSELKKIMNQSKVVGAKSVACGCPVCSSCLILYEVLFIGGSEITQAEALQRHYKCVKCDSFLADE
jgi:hypothetical protein